MKSILFSVVSPNLGGISRSNPLELCLGNSCLILVPVVPWVGLRAGWLRVSWLGREPFFPTRLATQVKKVTFPEKGSTSPSCRDWLVKINMIFSQWPSTFHK